MNRRIPSLLVGAIGVALILATVMANLFRAGPAFERVTDNFRPEMKASQLAQLRQDVNGLSAIQAEFATKVIPQLATGLNMTPQQLSALLGQQYPAVAAGLQNVPRITQEFNGVLNVLDAERTRFADADAIPTRSMPVTTVPWALAGAGLLCIAVAFVLPRRRGAASAVVLGVVLVAAPLVLSLPGKADAADTMNSHLKPVYTAGLVNGAQQSLAGMQAMGSELQTKLMPGLAQMLHMTPQQLQGYLATNFPTVSGGLASMPAALGRFDTLVKTFDTSLADYNTAKKTSLVPIVWVLLAAGLLVAGIGGWTLKEGQAGAPAVRRERAPLRHALAGHGRERLSH
jgi:hypothetical protein